LVTGSPFCSVLRRQPSEAPLHVTLAAEVKTELVCDRLVTPDGSFSNRSGARSDPQVDGVMAAASEPP
jgi:hypothetical protein